MKRFVYLIIFLVFLLIMKAFYLDPYLSEKFGDANQSAEGNVSAEENTSATNQAPAEDETDSASATSKAPAQKEKMPLDKLGDSIAEKLEEKIGKQ